MLIASKLKSFGEINSKSGRLTCMLCWRLDIKWFNSCEMLFLRVGVGLEGDRSDKSLIFQIALFFPRSLSGQLYKKQEKKGYLCFIVLPTGSVFIIVFLS